MNEEEYCERCNSKIDWINGSGATVCVLCERYICPNCTVRIIARETGEIYEVCPDCGKPDWCDYI